MNKIKVLQLCHGHAPPFGDVAVFYARLFDPERYEVTTIFLKDAPSVELEERLAPGKVVFYNLPGAKLKGLKLGLIRKLRQDIETNSYGMIIAHRNKSIYLATKASKGCQDVLLIGVVHAYGVFDRWTRRLLLKANRDRLHLLGVSNAIRDDIAVQATKVGFTQVYAQANCLALEKIQAAHYSREQARELLDLPRDAVLIGTAGRLHWEKDQATLIKAFAGITRQHPRAHLVIMGKGKLLKDLQELCHTLDITGQVTFTGMVADGARYFKAFDLFVMPSAVEPFGLVLTEAMAAGVAVLSSRTGGGEEILARDDLLFPIGDVIDCQVKMMGVLQASDAQKSEMIEWGLRRVDETYSERAFKERFWSQPFLRQHRLSC